jgi:hypothetical protein
LTVTTSSPVVKYQPVLQTAGNGEPRFDHNPATGESRGLMIEPTRTNSITYSQDFANSAWTKHACTIDANSSLAPDGTFTASKLTPNRNTNTEQRYWMSGGDAASSATRSWSVYLKAAGYSRVTLSHFSTNLYGDTTIVFDLDTLTFNYSTQFYSADNFAYEDVGNGWYRVTIQNKYYQRYFSIGVADPSGTGVDVKFAANGFDGILIWGAQVEDGVRPTSYIKTEASFETRGEDKLLCSGDSFDFFNNAEGTIFASYTKNALYIADSRFLAFTDRADTYSVNAFLLRGNDSPSSEMFSVFAYNSGQGAVTLENSDLDVSVAGSYAVNSIRGAVNGTAGTEDTSALIPHGINQMYLEPNNSAAFWFKKIAYYPKQFSTATLQAMTEE